MAAELRLLETDRVRHVAHIMGPESASAKAVAEFDRRTAAGEDVAIYEDGKTFVVALSTPPAKKETTE